MNLLEKKLKFEKGAINKKIGIKKRFISNQNQTTESLAARAIEQLSAKSKNLNFSEIISVTNTPSVFFPNYSHSIISKLKKNINTKNNKYLQSITFYKKYKRFVISSISQNVGNNN